MVKSLKRIRIIDNDLSASGSGFSVSFKSVLSIQDSRRIETAFSRGKSRVDVSLVEDRAGGQGGGRRSSLRTDRELEPAHLQLTGDVLARATG